MTAADLQPDKPSLGATALRMGAKVSRGKWSLTKEAYAKLLARFSPDKEEASKQLLIAYLKLVRFFEWNLCDTPEICADKSIDRAARRIDEGEHIDNLMSYLYGIADFVFWEWRKEQSRAPVALDPDDKHFFEPPVPDEEQEARLRCLDDCLEKLPAADRVLILGYYQEEKGAKIGFRKLIADRLGLGLNALRIRVYRIRTKLEACINDCLNQAGELK